MKTLKTLNVTRCISCIAPVALMAVMALPAVAQTTPTPHPHSVNSRLKEQNARIRQGVKSGSLTRREANRMRLRDSRIRYHQSRDRGDRRTHQRG